MRHPHLTLVEQLESAVHRTRGVRPVLMGRYHIATQATEVNCRFAADFQHSLCAERLEYGHQPSPQWSISTSTHSFIAVESPMSQTSATWLGLPGTGFDATVPVVGLLLLEGAEPAAGGEESSTKAIRVQVSTREAEGASAEWLRAVDRINHLGVATLPATFAGTVELGSDESRVARATFDLPQAQLTITYDESKGVALDLPHPVDGSPVDLDRLRSLLEG